MPTDHTYFFSELKLETHIYFFFGPKRYEAETSYKCLCYYPLHKLCFLLLLHIWFRRYGN